MNETTFLRLKEIEIHDFMGVEYGKIAFSNIDEEYKNGLKANVVGIYGPNGSGKSTLLDALKLLKEVLKDKDPADEKILKELGMGQGMKKVRIGCSHATLAFSFHICSPNGPEGKTLTYSFRIKEEDEFAIDDEEFKITEKKGKEILSLSCHNLEGNYMKRDALTTATTGIQKGSPEFKNAMKKARAIWRTAGYSHSLLLEFGREFGYSTKEMDAFNFFRKEVGKIMIFDGNDMSNLRSQKYPGYLASIKRGNEDVRLVLSPDGKIESVNHEIVDIEELDQVKNVVNTIMPTLIEGITVDIIKKEDGIYFVIVRNGIQVPYDQASYGFRKLLLISLSFVELFRSPSTIIVFDEIDEGIFEYLLGKIIKVVNNYAKGQLIFTAHNLRPLESLPFSSIRFTLPKYKSKTSKPLNQYMEVSNLNKASDLRSVYLRQLMKADFRNELMKILQSGKTPDEIITYFDTYVDSLVPRMKVLISNLRNTVSEVQAELEKANNERENLATALNDAYATLAELSDKEKKRS